MRIVLAFAFWWAVLGSGRFVTAQEDFRRGDVDHDGFAVTVNDVLRASPFFPPISCEAAGDANADQSRDISDLVYLFAYAAGLGSAPSAPGPVDCGPDPLVLLSCDTPCAVAVEPVPDSGQVMYIPDVYALSGGTTTVRVLFDSVDPTQGLSFGLRHDPTRLQIVDVSWGDAIVSLSDPGILESVTVHDDGLTAILLTALYGGENLIPAGNDHELLVIEYETLSAGEADLEFTEELGDPAMYIRTTLSGHTLSPSVGARPTTIDGMVLVDVEPFFRRGDANLDTVVDLGDAIHMFNNGFVAGSGPLECFDAADVNDDGLFDIADGIYLLTYLFTSGPPPAPPGTECGPDLTPDALDCFELGCP